MLCQSCGSVHAAVMATSDVEITYKCRCGEVYSISLEGRTKCASNVDKESTRKDDVCIIRLSDYR
jgi:lysyl-tRNA synthetase class I